MSLAFSHSLVQSQYADRRKLNSHCDYKLLCWTLPSYHIILIKLQKVFKDTIKTSVLRYTVLVIPPHTNWSFSITVPCANDSGVQCDSVLGHPVVFSHRMLKMS